MLASREGSQRPSRVSTERRKCVRGRGKGVSVAPGVGDDEQHAIHVAVPLLERDSALQGLEIVEHGLRLDRHDPAVAPDEGVPRASIAFDRERYLGSPP